MNDDPVIIGLVFKNTFWNGALFGVIIGFIAGWLYWLIRDE